MYFGAESEIKCNHEGSNTGFRYCGLLMVTGWDKSACRIIADDERLKLVHAKAPIGSQSGSLGKDQRII